MLKKLRKKNTRKLKPSPYRIPCQVVDETLKPFETFRKRYVLPVGASLNNNQEDIGEKSHELNNEEYNYENPNDSQYCNDGDENGYDDDDAGMNVSHTSEVGEHRQAGENGDFLAMEGIEVPDVVPKSTIGYARTAKKMNMRRLKCSVWDYLSGADTYRTVSYYYY